MTYSATFDTPMGDRTVTYNDEQIDLTSLARALRDSEAATPAEVARAAFYELEDKPLPGI